MRKRAMAAIGLLAVGAFLAGCTGTSGVNTQDLTSDTSVDDDLRHRRRRRHRAVAHRRHLCVAEPINRGVDVETAGTEAGSRAGGGGSCGDRGAMGQALAGLPGASAHAGG